MTAPLTGGCACGAIRYRAQGPVKFSLRCHCRCCQRNTGSGHAAQAAVPREGFSVTGTPATWTRQSDAGFEVIKAFCPACGCPLYGEPSRAPGLIMLMLGSLDDPSAIAPTKTVFSETAQPWDAITPEET